MTHTVIIRDFRLTYHDSSQSLTSRLSDDFHFVSILYYEESCVCTRLLQLSLQRDEQEASIYESIREVHEITHQQNERSMKRVRRMSLSSRSMNSSTHQRVFLDTAR